MTWADFAPFPICKTPGTLSRVMYTAATPFISVLKMEKDYFCMLLNVWTFLIFLPAPGAWALLTFWKWNCALRKSFSQKKHSRNKRRATKVLQLQSSYVALFHLMALPPLITSDAYFSGNSQVGAPKFKLCWLCPFVLFGDRHKMSDCEILRLHFCHT